VRIDQHRRPASPVAHERLQARDERRDQLGRGQCVRQQQFLDDAARRGIDGHGDGVDPRRRGMRFEIQQQQRAQHFRIAHGRRQLQAADVQGPRHEPEAQVQDGGAAIAIFEALAQGIEQPAEYERERLEILDGPLQFERCLERFFNRRRRQRPRVFAAREALPADAVLPQPLREVGRRQRGQFAQRTKTPANKHGQDLRTGFAPS
jgi:hypothetical protein